MRTIDRHGFLSLEPTLDAKYQRAIGAARDAAARTIAELTDFAAEVRRDPDLKESGIVKRLHGGLEQAVAHFARVFADARKGADGDRYRAASELQGVLWLGVNDERRLDRCRSELLALTMQHPVNARDVPFDPSTGAAILASGGRVLSLVDSLLREGDLEDARLLTLSVHRGGPILKTLVGGKPVLDAMLNATTARVVAEDSAAARLAAERDAADGVLSQIEMDERAARHAAAKTLGLPPAAADAIGRADPIKEAARRKSA